MNQRSILLLALCLAVSASARAQSFGIDWFTVDGGGGTSAGGNYTLSGTIGQPDAGTLSGGSYSLQGGFWGGAIDVQPPVPPTLLVTYDGANTVLSWTPASPGFVLQVSSSLSPAAWGPAPSGPTNPVSILPTDPSRFYRLFHQ